MILAPTTGVNMGGYPLSYVPGDSSRDPFCHPVRGDQQPLKSLKRAPNHSQQTHHVCTSFFKT